MVTITQDPQNPNRLTLTATVSVYLDRVLDDVMGKELELAIRAQAGKDLQHNRTVKKLIAKAATQRLLQLLGAEEPLPEVKECPPQA